MGLGVIGEYPGRMFDEAKCRPLYIIQDLYAPLAASGFAENQGRSQDATARIERQRSDLINVGR